MSILGINITQLKIFYVTQMINIDKEFKEVSNTDFSVDNQNMTTQVASITTRQIQEIDSPNGRGVEMAHARGARKDSWY